MIILAVIFFQQNPVPLVHCGHLLLVVVGAAVSPFLVVVCVLPVANVGRGVVAVVMVVLVVVRVVPCDGGVGPGPGEGGGPGPLSRQCIREPPGQPGALATSNSRVAVDAARTPYGGLKLPWSMGLFLATAHVMTQDPWFRPATVSFHSERYSWPLEGLGYVRVERYTGHTRSWPANVHPRAVPHRPLGTTLKVTVRRCACDCGASVNLTPWLHGGGAGGM